MQEWQAGKEEELNKDLKIFAFRYLLPCSKKFSTATPVPGSPFSKKSRNNSFS